MAIDMSDGNEEIVTEEAQRVLGKAIDEAMSKLFEVGKSQKIDPCTVTGSIAIAMIESMIKNEHSHCAASLCVMMLKASVDGLRDEDKADDAVLCGCGALH